MQAGVKSMSPLLSSLHNFQFAPHPPPTDTLKISTGSLQLFPKYCKSSVLITWQQLPSFDSTQLICELIPYHARAYSA